MDDRWGLVLLLIPVGYAIGSIPFGGDSMSLLDRLGYIRWGGENENDRLG